MLLPADCIFTQVVLMPEVFCTSTSVLQSDKNKSHRRSHNHRAMLLEHASLQMSESHRARSRGVLHACGGRLYSTRQRNDYDKHGARPLWVLTFQLSVVLVVHVSVRIASLAHKAAFMLLRHVLPYLILPIEPLVAKPACREVQHRDNRYGAQSHQC